MANNETKEPPFHGYGEMNVLMIKGRGFVYQTGPNRFQTFKGTKVPNDAVLICGTSFSKLMKRVMNITKIGMIDGQFGDIVVWRDRGMYIGCIGCEMYERPEFGKFDIITGEDIDEKHERIRRLMEYLEYGDEIEG